MGGRGSGRWNQNGKPLTENHVALDVRVIQRGGWLASCQVFISRWRVREKIVAAIEGIPQGDRLLLKYRFRSTEGWETAMYPVHLTWTSCTYGGQRAWFICPVDSCRRRVALLYLDGSNTFACRHCNRLAYASQREAPDYRASRRADKIRERLGWERGILNGKGWKPKGMHWKTYWRLTEKHDQLSNISLTGIAKWL